MLVAGRSLVGEGYTEVSVYHNFGIQGYSFLTTASRAAPGSWETSEELLLAVVSSLAFFSGRLSSSKPSAASRRRLSGGTGRAMAVVGSWFCMVVQVGQERMRAEERGHGGCFMLVGPKEVKTGAGAPARPQAVKRK